MSNIFKPIHAVVVAFVLGVLGTSAIVLATSTTSYEPGDQSALALTATFVRNTLYDSNDGPTASTLPATPAPRREVPAPVRLEPAPAPGEPPRSCAEIQASGTYLSDAERGLFLGSCLVSSGRSASATSAVGLAVSSEEERAYRVKAEGIAYASLRSLERYERGELLESEAALVEYGARAGGWANQINNFEPVPARFLPAHQRLQVALWELDAHARLLVTGQADISNQDYADLASQLVEAVDVAVAAYFQVLGLSLPSP